jgi:aryl-alcohol dehydrogenase-like predicted oxidoreductase
VDKRRGRVKAGFAVSAAMRREGDDMQYRQLGRTGLRVSAFTLGTMGFGGTGWATPVGKIDVDGAREEIAIARDFGVNMIDTADVYSAGLSEEILGQALAGTREE